MYIITTVEDKIRSLPERYKHQLFIDGKWKYPELEGNYNTLKKICVDCTAEDIKNIMGNDNWIRLICDMCRQSVPVIIAYYVSDDNNVIVCENCADSALKNLRKRKKFNGKRK
jgi:hypothetical protein